MDDCQCSFDINSENTYETEMKYSSDSDTDFSENVKILSVHII